VARKRPPFSFAGRSIHKPDCVVFSREGQPNTTSQPWVGYFHYPSVEQHRKQILKPRRHHEDGGHNAGWGLYWKRLSRITPKEWSRDPYLVCVLLAIAQLQVRSVESLKSAIHVVSPLLLPLLPWLLVLQGSLGLFARCMALIIQAPPPCYERL